MLQKLRENKDCFCGCVGKNERGDKLRSSWFRFKPLDDQVQPVQVAAQPSAQIILRCVRWYLSYPLSYRQVAEMVNERGMDIDHTKVFRWVQEYGQELDRRCRPHLRPTNDSWRVDETYIKVKGKDRYSGRQDL